jgi:hypothetical protein
VSSTATADAERSTRRWLAVALAFVMPGAGHLYLRSWIRALLWFGLFYTTFLLLVPAPAQETDLSIDGLLTVVTAVPIQAQLAVVAITLLNMADAYWLASKQNARAAASDALACPNCGKELDDDIDFCHWCTTRIERPATDDESAA